MLVVWPMKSLTHSFALSLSKGAEFQSVPFMRFDEGLTAGFDRPVLSQSKGSPRTDSGEATLGTQTGELYGADTGE